MLQTLRAAWLASMVLVVPSLVRAADGVQVKDEGAKVKIEINGQPFTEYHYTGAPHVYYHPVLGPKGLPMTRNYPMVKDVPDEPSDHPHQRSLWFSHGQVNGFDFWAEGTKSGHIVHDKFLELRSGKEEGVVRSANKWVTPEGKVVCTDERVFRVYNRADNERLFDFEVTIKASEGDLVLGDTKEGSFGVRLPPTMQLKGPVAKGHIVQSTGAKDGDTWGKRAEWCDYYGPVKEKIVGVAIFDNPKNPRHPTWWHVRDYGLFAANPFGIHDFENKEKGAGDMKIKGGESVTFRYRVYLHEGDTQQAKVAERYAEYSK